MKASRCVLLVPAALILGLASPAGLPAFARGEGGAAQVVMCPARKATADGWSATNGSPRTRQPLRYEPTSPSGSPSTRTSISFPQTSPSDSSTASTATRSRIARWTRCFRVSGLRDRRSPPVWSPCRARPGLSRRLPICTARPSRSMTRYRIPTSSVSSTRTVRASTARHRTPFLLGAGFIYVGPDYLGLGDSPVPRHRYFDAATEASSAVDLLTASRRVLASLHVRQNNKLFTFGFSQGGHAALALHRELQSANVDVTGTATVGGVFDLEQWFLGRAPGVRQ